MIWILEHYAIIYKWSGYLFVFLKAFNFAKETNDFDPWSGIWYRKVGIACEFSHGIYRKWGEFFEPFQTKF